jgi:hypothetical protein
MLIDFARIIRANKNLPWDQYLTREDMGLIQGNIYPVTWYPFEAFERISYTVFMLIGKGDLMNARTFGAFTIQDTFHKVYGDVLFRDKDPVAVLKKFVTLQEKFFKFQDISDPLKMELLEGNKVKIIIRAPSALGIEYTHMEAYTHYLAGAFQKVIEGCAKGVRINIIKIQSETEPASEIELTWSNIET